MVRFSVSERNCPTILSIFFLVVTVMQLEIRRQEIDNDKEERVAITVVSELTGLGFLYSSALLPQRDTFLHA